jgi:hypothetical protein
MAERRFTAAEVRGAELEAADVEHVQSDLQPFAGLSEKVFLGHDGLE